MIWIVAILALPVVVLFELTKSPRVNGKGRNRRRRR